MNYPGSTLGSGPFYGVNMESRPLDRQHLPRRDASLCLGNRSLSSISECNMNANHASIRVHKSWVIHDNIIGSVHHHVKSWASSSHLSFGPRIHKTAIASITGTASSATPPRLRNNGWTQIGTSRIESTRWAPYTLSDPVPTLQQYRRLEAYCPPQHMGPS